jgi:cytochrome o ubiquinol oxidase subunit 2
MKWQLKVAALVLLITGLIGLGIIFLHGSDFAVLNPRGIIAAKERTLLITASLLSLLVVIPVFVMTGIIAYRYRATNKAAHYAPEWDHNRTAETIWWTIPSVLIFVLAIITWSSSHELDPSKALASATPPITIQVIALDWKWLFIYPDQHIATVNFIQFPQGTPINFVITSDAPMNSFWIPQLGGQIYAMPGMSTRLSLLADQLGDFHGSSANISGRGFAQMRFIARSSTELDFENWVKSAQSGPASLDQNSYNELLKPTVNDPVRSYRLADSNLYDKTVMKYMMPAQPSSIGSGQ